MTITPRGNEISAVVAIIDPDGEDPEGASDMAKAIIKAVVSELAERDVYAVTVGFPNEGTWLPVGPFYGEGAARKFTLEARSNHGQLADMALMMAPNRVYAPAPDLAPDCVCGHHRSMHHSGKATSADVKGCGFPMPVKGRKTSNKPCPCSGFREKENAA